MTSQVIHQIVNCRQGKLTPASGEVLRLERCITNAERRVEEQELRLRQAMLAGHNTAVDEFALQKMQLLLAILREGRERMARQLGEAVQTPPASARLKPAAPSASA